MPKPVGDEATHVTGGRVGIPHRCAQQPLQRRRMAVAGLLRQRPAGLAFHSGQQARHKGCRSRPRLAANEPARDPPDSLIQYRPPTVRVYAMARGHCPIFGCPHKPSMIMQWPSPRCLTPARSRVTGVRMDDDLLHRLRVEQSRAMLDNADPNRAVMLACDLVVAGVDGDAVVELAAQSARTLPPHEANRRLAALTAELGLPEPDLPTAVALGAANTCEQILDHSIPAEVAAHALYVVGYEGSPVQDLLPAVSALACRLEDDLGGQADHDLPTRLAALARTILSRLAPKDPA
jgi:hypothetical protein